MNAHDERRQIRNSIRKDKRYQNFITNLHKEEAIQCLMNMGASVSKEELYENLLCEPYIKKIVVQMNRNNLHFKFIEPKRNGEYRRRLLTDLVHIILKEETLPFYTLN